jgi:hypothetical protein
MQPAATFRGFSALLTILTLLLAGVAAPSLCQLCL